MGFSSKRLRGGVLVLGTSEVINTVQSHDQIINLLYTTGYRLTGSHQLTAELIAVSIDALNQPDQNGHHKFFKGLIRKTSERKSQGTQAILKTLCTNFINKNAVLGEREQVAAAWHTLKGSRSKPQLQAALLQLPPMQRVLVVLRDILNLNYAEMAELTGLEKSDVAGLLDAGRWSLRELIEVPAARENLAAQAISE